MEYLNLIGQKFGRLTIIDFAEPKKWRDKEIRQWKCKCECGVEMTVIHTDLVRGHTKSCGCLRIKDLTGLKFGRWTVLRRDKHRRKGWICECECGTIASVQSTHLTSNPPQSRSCGCLAAELTTQRCLVDLTGKRFNRLLVLERSFDNPSYGRPRWKCLCDCGKETIVNGGALISSATQSCGCLRAERKGPNHPSWDSTLTDEERLLQRRITPFLKSWRREVLERDGWTCQITGVTDVTKLRAHHIYSFKQNPELRVNINNGITLTDNVHNLFHLMYGKDVTSIEWENFVEFSKNNRDLVLTVESASKYPFVNKDPFSLSFNLKTIDRLVLPPFEISLVKTDFKMDFYSGFWGMVTPAPILGYRNIELLPPLSVFSCPAEIELSLKNPNPNPKIIQANSNIAVLTVNCAGKNVDLQPNFMHNKSITSSNAS